jgi:hypothetical protein
MTQDIAEIKIAIDKANRAMYEHMIGGRLEQARMQSWKLKELSEQALQALADKP